MPTERSVRSWYRPDPDGFKTVDFILSRYFFGDFHSFLIILVTYDIE